MPEIVSAFAATCQQRDAHEPAEELQPSAVAKLLKALVDKEQPQPGILGKRCALNLSDLPFAMAATASHRNSSSRNRATTPA
ncbi:hypothetical protein HDG33_006123 [Paraburkholderia sp. Cpub6]|nr:hypothetical protein [Paraburkholderia sp. Cpub6]